ncbi:MAG TPA: glycosyltransferase [Longimicrobiales bacterium]|nr:glycosyltransferase [Longimicrobiales bacterium]
MRRPRYTLMFLSGVLLVVALAGVLSILIWSFFAPPDIQNALVRGTVVLLILFLGILVIRYVVLLWLGYLQHVEQAMSPEEERKAAPAMLPPVSVLIPAYNEGLVIQDAIRSVLRLDYPRLEILVIDDGSTDDTAARAAAMEGRHGKSVVRVISKANAGKAAALNTGIALARYPFVCCIDGDSTLAPGSLRATMRHFRDPRVAAVAGNVKVENRRNLWSRLQALEYIEGLNMPRRAQGFLRAVNIIPGPIGVFRREVLRSLGGYDSDTFAEDADLTLKILTHGYRIEYAPDAIAYTEAPETLMGLLRQRYRWTRGILQAIGKRRSALLSSKTDVAVWLSVAMMLFEAVIWPFMNVVGNLFFIGIFLAFDAGAYVVSWWLLLTLLDVAAALHTVAIEGEDLSLVPLAVIYRFFFILFIDVAKLLASVEEALKLDMTWGKLERVGRPA